MYDYLDYKCPKIVSILWFMNKEGMHTDIKKLI